MRSRTNLTPLPHSQHLAKTSVDFFKLKIPLLCALNEARRQINGVVSVLPTACAGARPGCTHARTHAQDDEEKRGRGAAAAAAGGTDSGEDSGAEGEAAAAAALAALEAEAAVVVSLDDVRSVEPPPASGSYGFEYGSGFEAREIFVGDLCTAWMPALNRHVRAEVSAGQRRRPWSRLRRKGGGLLGVTLGCPSGDVGGPQ